MRKKVLSYCCVSVAVLLLVISCTPGLEPAWKHTSDTRLSFQFSSLDEASPRAQARALVQGPAWLYIRTLGGPVGDKGPFYGPYAVQAGTKFTTTDIPDGTFAEIGVFYCAEKLDETRLLYVEESQLSLGAVMRLPDDQFTAVMDSEAAYDFYSELAGHSSTGSAENVVIRPGVINTLSLTLVPMSSYDLSTYFVEQTASLSLSSEVSVRKFIEVSELPQPQNAASAEFSIKISTTSTAPVPVIGRSALYTSAGKLIASWPASGNLSAAQPIMRKVPWSTISGLDPYVYLYLEYSGSVQLEFALSEGTVPVTDGTVTVNAGSSAAGKRFFYGLYSESTIALYMQNNPETEDVFSELDPEAFGIISLDAAGSGSGAPMSFNEITEIWSPYTLSPGEYYYVSGFVDMNNTWAAFQNIEEFTPGMMLMPLTGDPVTDSEEGPYRVLSDSSGKILVPSSAFVQYEDIIFFVSGSGGGTGLSPASPASWAAIQDKINTADPMGDAVMIMLLDNVVATSWLNVSADTLIMSYNQETPVTVTISGTPSAPLFTVKPDKVLSLYNVVLDGSGVILSDSAIVLEPAPIEEEIGGILYAGEGTVIRNMTLNDKNGGAISAFAKSSVVIDGATITGCSALYGGAIYAENGASILWSSGSITGNSATTAGGGVYLNGAYIVDVITGTPINVHPNITGNYAAGLESNIVYVGGTGVQVWVSISFLETGDPVISPQNISVASGEQITLMVPPEYETYSWSFNGYLLENSTNECIFIPTESGIPWNIGNNNFIDLVVTDSAGDYFSAQIQVTITE